MTLPDSTNPPSDPVSTPPVPDAQKGGTPPPTENWEEKYKGLQRIIATRDESIRKLTEEKGNLVTQLEELKSSSGHTEAVKGDLEKAKTNLEGQITTLGAQVKDLQKQLAQQSIVMKDFPQLTGLLKYIPPAEDEAAFRANATQFAEDMKIQIQAGVKDVMTGGTPPQPSGDRMSSEKEMDAIYQKMVKVAGIAGKEKEYEDLRDQWVKLKLPK